MGTLFFEARIGIYSTDLGIYLTAGLYIGLIQLLLWAIARHSADIEVWRTAAPFPGTNHAPSVGS